VIKEGLLTGVIDIGVGQFYQIERVLFNKEVLCKEKKSLQSRKDSAINSSE
jgi:hypothetical protein